MENNNSKESPDGHHERRESDNKNEQLNSLNSRLNSWLYNSWAGYYDDGTIANRGKYRNYKMNGPWSFFFKGTGKIKQQGFFKNNSEIGLWYEATYND